MTNWQHRRMLLAFTFAGVIFTFAKFSLDSTAGNRSVTPFTSPSVVPLAGWQFTKSLPLTLPEVDSEDNYGIVSTSRQYNYRQESQQLEVEIHYETGTLGNFYSYIKYYSPMQWDSLELMQDSLHQKGVGFYNMFVSQGRSHLVACINPRGGSTVTPTQFSANRRTYDLQFQRLLPWFLGKESLIDRRCLWTHLSMPLDRMSAKTTYPILEKAWQSWYHWWSDRFPQH